MSAPKRIAFDARYINDQYHGIGRYAFRLLEGMVAAAPEATFIVYKGRGRDTRFDWATVATRPNVELREGPWPLYWPHEQLVWPLLLRRDRADMFYSPYFVAPLVPSCPAVITVHDLIFDRYPGYMPWRWSRPYYQWLMRWGTRRAQRIITVSQATAAELAYHYEVPQNKIVTILEGAAEFHRVTDQNKLQALCDRYGLKRPFVLAVGTRRPHKNLARLVTAFARAGAHATHDLVFAGPADSRFPDEARQAALALKLDSAARFLGWVPEADLPGLYTLADLFVIPSLVEGFGLPALEAMACGTPVVASNVSSLPEVVEDAGVLVDPLDIDAWAAALQALLNDPTKRQCMAKAGLRRVEAFTWPQMAAQVLQAFDELSASRRLRSQSLKMQERPTDPLRVSS
jgi:glycosyltransferase involved in cell wall biosynthesis